MHNTVSTLIHIRRQRGIRMTQNTDPSNQKTDYKAPFVLGLDVGTSSTRALLFDATGATVSHVQSQRTYQLTTSDEGEVSVDADALLSVVAETIDEALKQAGELAKQIAAVATDTFWHNLLGIDESRRPVMPVITWEDTRPHSVVADLRKQLDDLRDSVRGLTSEYADRWPALRDVPWFPAIGDGASACIGSGCATSDNWSLTIGTSSAMRVVIAPEQTKPPLGLWLYLIDAKRAVLGGALSEGGNMLSWLDTVLKLPELKDAEPLIADLEPDAHGLTILPFLSGERSLGWHAEARMTISGIGRHTTPAELLRAGMESLAYRLATVYEQIRGALEVEHPRVIGSGGALLGSSLLQSIIADTINAAIYPSRNHEASARGAALLALEAMGVIADVAQVAPALDAPTNPNAERGKRYQSGLERQKKLYQLLLGNLEGM